MVDAAASSAPSMIVGVDGSDGSRSALRWAHARVGTFGPIQPVISWKVPWWGTVPPAGESPRPPSRDFLSDQAHRLVENETASIPATNKLPPILARGHAGRALCSIPRPVDLIVVGARGRGAVAEALTGSTSSYCAAHSHVPVVVVPQSAPPLPTDNHLVVGIDGSENSIAAFQWAIDHCPVGATIEALHAFVPGARIFERSKICADEQEEQAVDLLERSVRRAVQKSVRPAAEYETVSSVILADPRQALVEVGADLIVVGARGHRAVPHLLLGSVTTALTHHMQTTTVVVPDQA